MTKSGKKSMGYICIGKTSKFYIHLFTLYFKYKQIFLWLTHACLFVVHNELLFGYFLFL